jgi:excisionase family DNA binding protein
VPIAPLAPPELPPYVSIQQFADYLNTSTRSVARWIAANQLPTPRRLGRHRLWARDELTAFLSGRTEAVANA